MSALPPNIASDRVMLSIIRITIVTVVSIAIVASSLAVPGQDSVAADQDVKWLTANEIKKSNELAISAWWRDAELKDRLTRFSRNQAIAIFLDRRVDPSTMIEVTVRDATKEQFMWQVAETARVGICQIDDFYYVGPPKSAAIFPTVCQQLRQTTSKQRRKAKVDWNSRQPMKTDSVVKPKKLRLDLAEANSFQIENIDAIPHDIWAGFELPKTTLQIRVAVLLVGFGKTFERNENGTVIKIVDIPEFQKVEASFRDLEDANALARVLRPKFPDVKLVVRGKRLVATGPPMQVATVQGHAVKAQIPRGVGSGKKTFTFTTRAQRGVVLATAAQGSNSKLVFDKSNQDITNALREPIEVSVVNADASGLVQMALQGTNLKYEMNEDEIRITER